MVSASESSLYLNRLVRNVDIVVLESIHRLLGLSVHARDATVVSKGGLLELVRVGARSAPKCCGRESWGVRRGAISPEAPVVRFEVQIIS